MSSKATSDLKHNISQWTDDLDEKLKETILSVLESSENMKFKDYQEFISYYVSLTPGNFPKIWNKIAEKMGMSKSVIFKHFQNYHIKQSLSPWPKDIWNQALDLMEDEIRNKQPGLDFKLERKQAIHNVDQNLGL